MNRQSEMVVDVWNSGYGFAKMGESRQGIGKAPESCQRILRLETGADMERRMRVTPLSGFASPPTNPRVNLSLDEAIQFEIRHGRKLNPNMDKRKLRRTISNRLSAQRSRMKRAQYIHEMEQMVIELERMISAIAPQIESYKEQLQFLIHQNTSLQEIVEIRSNESKLRERELERTQMEAYRLKEVAKVLSRSSHGSGLGLGFHAEHYPYDPQGGGAMEAGCGVEWRKGFKTKQPQGETHEEETEVDQYINFEAVNSDTASPAGTRTVA